ncbi:cell division protein ZapA [Rhodoferax koreense]|uniref:Cell division protein ZapA n=1 Tax=Rhodoferax koreensis TaxID=1842727 RepID=A0A1P8JV90_9BURK|nr:cell division protein ZapA [Rhodoferax koreense]APW37696.1 cell division protein ZapA [Rhodoferax koreense]
MNQLEVQIMGQSYRLGCPEDGAERLQAAVAKVDAAMCAIRDAGKVKARDRIAVLAALNLAFDLSDRAPAPTVAAPAPAVAASPLPEGSDTQLGSLLARLDEALGDDGRLI